MPGKALHWTPRYFTQFKRDGKNAVRCNFCQAVYLENTGKMEHHILVSFTLL